MRVSSIGGERNRGSKTDMNVDFIKEEFHHNLMPLGEVIGIVYLATINGRRARIEVSPSDVAALMLAMPSKVLAKAIASATGTEHEKELANLPNILHDLLDATLSLKRPKSAKTEKTVKS